MFAAIDRLTFREMRELSALLALQAEGRDVTDPAAFAELLADACDSHFASEEDD